MAITNLFSIYEHLEVPQGLSIQVILFHSENPYWAYTMPQAFGGFKSEENEQNSSLMTITM